MGRGNSPATKKLKKVDTAKEQANVQNFKELIIDLLFHQRYLRCDDCGQSVFSEPVKFGEKGCNLCGVPSIAGLYALPETAFHRNE